MPKIAVEFSMLAIWSSKLEQKQSGHRIFLNKKRFHKWVVCRHRFDTRSNAMPEADVWLARKKMWENFEMGALPT